ncbi:MAG: caspase family protein, partial [Planctomycetes bacterium]|nr:caspase family protein [Planctomycetota bacterium]
MTQVIPNTKRSERAERASGGELATFDRLRSVIARFGEFDARPGALNLLGIRGYLDGQPVANRPDEYNDTIAALWYSADGRPQVRQFRASVDPGQYYTDNPMRPEGTAHLVEGHYRYKRGLHKGRPALVQAAPVTVWRDRDRDDQQDAGEVVETGWFGINIHDGGTGTQVGKWSSGCQVVHGGRSGADWRRLMELVDANTAETVGYTLVDRAVLGLPFSDGAAPEPARDGTGAAARPLLRVGCSGTEVRDLQRTLDNHGFNPGEIDGIFGRKTEQAVIGFQRAEHLQADGIVGPQTWSALSRETKGLAPRGEKRALLVAINDYGDPRNNLPSCVADAHAFRAMLERYGFDASGLRMITDADATVEAVSAGLDWLCDGLGAEDRAVFFYSGHGHQLPVDGVLTEVLVLRDGFYIDDVLADRTQDLPDGVLTAVLDSCFSGGMDKIVFGNVDGSADFAAPKRWTATAPGAAKKAGQGDDAASVTGYRRFGSSSRRDDEAHDVPLKGLMLCACSENETAAASTSRTRGLSAFSFALLEALERHGKDASASVLMHSVAGILKDGGFRQTPTLHEPPGPFRLAERSFIELLDEDSPEPLTDEDAW